MFGIIFIILCWTSTSLALEHSGSSETSSKSPRELAIQGTVAREYTQSKKDGRIKTETLSALFVSGKKISITCTHKGKTEKYIGFIEQKNKKLIVSSVSAEQDFKKLKLAYLQNNSTLKS
ncbi:hypothetical protein BH09DEP1_BH09DEP1_7740 [soil metagenome]